MAKVDAEYREYLDETAAEALERAREHLPGDVPATFVRHSARSAPVGLLELAEEHGANVIVLGLVLARPLRSHRPGQRHRPSGAQLARDPRTGTARLPVQAGPEGRPRDRGLRRLGECRRSGGRCGDGGCSHQRLAADRLVRGLGTPGLHDHAWAPTPRTASSTSGPQPWSVPRATPSQAVEGLSAAPPVEAVIGRGSSWAEAIDDIGWNEGDVLVVGSSELGPVAQVFLGSRATKILRHSPAPTFVVPRSRAETLAHA